MLCQNCKTKEATFFYEEDVNGTHKSIALCSDCAQKSGIENTIQTNNIGFFTDLENQFLNSFYPFNQPSLSDKKKCPVCGLTFNELAKLGKVGCTECYKTFEKELKNTILSYHGNNKYIQENKNITINNDKKTTNIDTLTKSLQQAIENEDYETAAKLRDEIKSLKEKKDDTNQ